MRQISEESKAKLNVSNYIAETEGVDPAIVRSKYKHFTKQFGLSENSTQAWQEIEQGKLEKENREKELILNGMYRLGYDNPDADKGEHTLKDDRNMAIRGATAEGFYSGTEGVSRNYNQKVKADLSFSNKLADNVNKWVQLSGLPTGVKESVMSVTAEWKGLNESFADLDPSEWYADAVSDTRDTIREEFPVSQKAQESIRGGVFQGLGQAAGILPTYAVPLVGPTNTVGMIYQQGYDDYVDTTKAKGNEVDLTKAHEAGLKNTPSAAFEILGDRFVIGKILKPLKGKITIKDIGKSALSSAIVGGSTEGAQTTWENFNAKYLSGYDENRSLDDEVFKSIVIGSIVDSSISTTAQSTIGGVDAITDKLSKRFNPVTGLSKQDIAASKNVYTDEEFNAWADKKFGDARNDENELISDLAKEARNGNAEAKTKFIKATTIDVKDSYPILTNKEFNATEEDVEAAKWEIENEITPVEKRIINKEFESTNDDLNEIKTHISKAVDDTISDEKLITDIENSIETLVPTEQDPDETAGESLTPTERESLRQSDTVKTRQLNEEALNSIKVEAARIAPNIEVNDKRETKRTLQSEIDEMFGKDLESAARYENSVKQSYEADTGIDITDVSASDINIKGSATTVVDKADADGIIRLKGVANIYNTGDTQTAVEEVTEAKVQLDLRTGKVTERKINGWIQTIQKHTDDRNINNLNVKDASIDDKIEWLSSRAVEWFNTKNEHNTDSLPKVLVNYLKQIAKYIASVVRRGKILRQLDDEGKLPQEFKNTIDILYRSEPTGQTVLFGDTLFNRPIPTTKAHPEITKENFLEYFTEPKLQKGDVEGGIPDYYQFDLIKKPTKGDTDQFVVGSTYADMSLIYDLGIPVPDRYILDNQNDLIKEEFGKKIQPESVATEQSLVNKLDNLKQSLLNVSDDTGNQNEDSQDRGQQTLDTRDAGRQDDSGDPSVEERPMVESVRSDTIGTAIERIDELKEFLDNGVVEEDQAQSLFDDILEDVDGLIDTGRTTHSLSVSARAGKQISTAEKLYYNTIERVKKQMLSDNGRVKMTSQERQDIAVARQRMIDARKMERSIESLHKKMATTIDKKIKEIITLNENVDDIKSTVVELEKMIQQMPVEIRGKFRGIGRIASYPNKDSRRRALKEAQLRINNIINKNEYYKIRKKARDRFSSWQKLIKKAKNDRTKLKVDNGDEIQAFIESYVPLSSKEQEMLEKEVESLTKEMNEILIQSGDPFKISELENQIEKIVIKLNKASLLDYDAPLNILQDFLQDLESIEVTGKTAYDLDQRRIQKERREIADKLVAELGGEKDRASVDTETASLIEKALDIISHGGRPEALAQIMFNRVYRQDNTFIREILEKLFDAETTFERNYANDIEAATESLKGVDLNKEEVFRVNSDFELMTLNNNVMMAIYGYSQNESALNHLLSSTLKTDNGNTFLIDEAFIQKVTKVLDPKAKLAVDTIIDYNDTVMFDRLNVVAREKAGISMTKEDRYLPIMNLKRNVSASEGIIKENNVALGINSGMTKSRVKSELPFSELSFDKIISQGYHSANRQFAYAIPFNEVTQRLNYVAKDVDEQGNEIFRYNLQDQLKNRSKVGTKALNKWLARQVDGRYNRSSLEFLSALRNNVTISVIGGNVKSLLFIPLAGIQSIGMAKNRKRFTAQLIKSVGLLKINQNVKDAKKLSPFIASRGKNININFQEMAERRALFELQGFKDKKGLDKAKSALIASQELSMSLMEAVDIRISSTVFMAQYNSSIKEHGDVERAIKEAEQLVRTTQSTQSMAQSSELFASQNVLEKMMRSFTGDMNMNINNWLALASDKTPNKNGKARSKTDRYGSIFIMLIAQAALVTLIESMYEELREELGVIDDKDDDDDLLKDFAVETANQVTGGYPVVSDVVGGFVGWGIDHEDKIWAGDMSLLGFKDIQNLSKIIENPKTGVDALFKLRGVPARTFWKPTLDWAWEEFE